MRAYFYLLVLSFSASLHFSAHAAPPVVTGATGVSAITLTGSTGGSATIYGGFAGLSTACPTDTNVCNNCSAALNACADQPLCACNTSRAYNTQVVTISLTTDVAGQAIVAKTDGSLLTGVLLNPGNDGTSVQFTWGAMCNALLNGGGSCEGTLDSTSGSFRIYLDKDRDGQADSDEESVEVGIRILNPGSTQWNVFGGAFSEGIGGSQGFVPYPGDEKIYVEDVDTHTSFPLLTYGGQVTKVRVFMSAAGMGSAVPESSLEPEDLTVEEDGAVLGNAVVDGLENGTRYAFRVALLDEANNVVQFFPSAASATANGCDSSPPADSCPWAATPDQVLGLLTEDFNCFIASAAYGSSIEPKLNVFRKFRFKILLQTKWGRAFVEQYYKYGPYAARYIHDKPILRGIARGFLWPLYGFSLLSLTYGLWPAVAVSLILLISISALLVTGMRRLQKRG